MKQDIAQLAPYPFLGQPLMPEAIQQWILSLFSGQSVERKKIVESVLKAHRSRGGAEPNAADFPRSVKQALGNLNRAGKATKGAKGWWSINSEEDVVNPVLPMSNESDKAVGEPPEPEPPADHVFGTGTSSVYVYYYDNYRKNALLSNLDRWPCKVGRTDTDPLYRVISQAATALPELPHIAIILRTSNASRWESAIHLHLTERGLVKKDAPGSEWFNTSPEEILNIIRSINPTLISQHAVDPGTT